MFVNSNSSYGFLKPKQANNMYTDSDFSSFYTNAADHDEAHNSVQGSPMMASPWNNVLSPLNKPNFVYPIPPFPGNYTLVGSLVREEGHVYSLATKPGDLLYTGSDSKNIRVWKNFKDYGGFKSASGLVKAIVISGDKIFTGHQDGKIRVWKVSPKDASVHKRYGSLPTLKDLFKYSMRPSNYIEVKRRRSVWIKHSDAISCLSLVEDEGLLYSSSWDQTFKVWRISDSKCLESVMAHEDSVNAVVSGTDAIVYTGSADGTVKVWRREMQGKVTKHFLVRTLMKQECAVTALAVDPTESVLYCGSSDGLVNFWDRKRSLAHGGALRGHKLAVLCLVARGTLVFSGSTDKSICVWRRDGMEHMRILVLSGHAGPVKCLAVEEDKEKGKWKLYSGSLDKSVKVWSVGEQSVGMVQHQAIDVGSGVEKFSSDSSIFRLR